MFLWWGIFIAATPVFGNTFRWIAIASPLFTMVLILLLSGVNIGEESANKKYGLKPEYIAYKEQTSNVIPLPNGLYKVHLTNFPRKRKWQYTLCPKRRLLFPFLCRVKPRQCPNLWKRTFFSTIQFTTTFLKEKKQEKKVKPPRKEHYTALNSLSCPHFLISGCY